MDTYKIVSVNSGKAVGVRGNSLQKGAAVEQQTWQNRPSQQWFLLDVEPVNGRNVCVVICADTGMVLDVEGVSTADGAAVHQWDYYGGNNQRWFLDSAVSVSGAKTFQLVSVNSGKALTVVDESDKDGAPLIQSTAVNAPWQQWQLEVSPTQSKGPYLLATQYLAMNEFLVSRNGKYCAYQQGDGNFVLCYALAGAVPPAADLARPYWSAFADLPKNTAGTKKAPPYIAAMQTDANFVLYNGRSYTNTSGPYWASNTARSQNSRTLAMMQDDGSLGLYNSGDPTAPGTAYWTTNSNWVSKRVNAVTSLSTGQELGVDGYLVSPNTKYCVTIQSDGNFVLYRASNPTDKSTPLWSSGTQRGQGQYLATMQDDGNFVVYNGPNSNKKGGAIWSTTVRGPGEYRASVQDGGTFSIFTADQPDIPFWTTYSRALPGSSLRSGEYLGPGDALVSTNGKYRAVIQPDGNFVIFQAVEPGQPSGTVWVARSNSFWHWQGTGTYFALLRYDGALALSRGIDDKAPVYWNTAAQQRGRYVAELQDDGTLTIRVASDPGAPRSLVSTTEDPQGTKVRRSSTRSAE